MFIGEGPELPRVREAAAGLDGVIFTGALPHAQMPACLAACDIGVAPFDAGVHRPLSLGFYWSPLKIFEYMAAGLPVVAPAFDRILALVEHNREGLLYRRRDPHRARRMHSTALTDRASVIAWGAPRATAPSANTAGLRIAARSRRRWGRA